MLPFVHWIKGEDARVMEENSVPVLSVREDDEEREIKEEEEEHSRLAMVVEERMDEPLPEQTRRGAVMEVEAEEEAGEKEREMRLSDPAPTSQTE